jgi:hypothetical protein
MGSATRHNGIWTGRLTLWYGVPIYQVGVTSTTIFSEVDIARERRRERLVEE